jgi:hypothetical protein
MDFSPIFSTLLVSSLLGAVVILVSAFSVFWKTHKPFDVPILGQGEDDINILKLRYVQEADVLLREGYHKVQYTIDFTTTL